VTPKTTEHHSSLATLQNVSLLKQNAQQYPTTPVCSSLLSPFSSPQCQNVSAHSRVTLRSHIRPILRAFLLRNRAGYAPDMGRKCVEVAFCFSYCFSYEEWRFASDIAYRFPYTCNIAFRVRLVSWNSPLTRSRTTLQTLENGSCLTLCP